MYLGKDDGTLCQEIPFEGCLLMMSSSLAGCLAFIYERSPTLKCSEGYGHCLIFVTHNPGMSHKIFLSVAHL